MMLINDMNIYVEEYGNKKGPNIVFLHGWGGSTKTMKPIGDGLKDDFYITLIDLPGFGQSEEPQMPLNVYDYADLLKILLKKLKINQPIIMGHSFGGRIAIIYAANNPVSKLILSGSPYKRTTKKPSVKVKLLKSLAKVSFLKPVATQMKNKMGSIDYRSASPIMKEILVKAIHEDLTTNLPKIKCPTLLIWGSADTEVNIADAKAAETIIPDAGLVVYENASHYAYLEEAARTIIILKSFLKEKK